MENAGDAEVEEDTFVAGEEGLKGETVERGSRDVWRDDGGGKRKNGETEFFGEECSVKLGINSMFVEYFSTIDYTITVKWSASSRERLD